MASLAPTPKRLAAMVLLCAAAAGCPQSQPQSGVQPQSQSRPHVIVLVIDTLRVDRVDAFGGARGASPFLDSLAERSYVFRDAYAPSPWTSPSVASLFTSRYPSQHNVTHFSSVLSKREQTLAELLRRQGYATGGFSSNPLIRSRSGFAQGFHRFATASGGGKALSKEFERSQRAGLRAATWIDELPASSRERVFLYLHVMDPHTPYTPSRHALDWAFEEGDVPNLERVNQLLREPHRFEPAEREMVERLYDAEVRSSDQDLEKVFGELEERGLLSNAVVVVVSDHGEEFWEHGARGHGNGLYDELIRVPLLISVPGQARRVDVLEPVSVIDVAPTILDLVGLPVPHSFEGHSLRPLLSRYDTGLRAWLNRIVTTEQRAPRPVISESIQPRIYRRRLHERAVVIGRYKLIADIDGSHHFFDRRGGGYDGPDGDVPDEARRALEEELAAFVSRLPTHDGAEHVPIDDEMKRHLNALGYAY